MSEPEDASDTEDMNEMNNQPIKEQLTKQTAIKEQLIKKTGGTKRINRTYYSSPSPPPKILSRSPLLIPDDVEVMNDLGDDPKDNDMDFMNDVSESRARRRPKSYLHKRPEYVASERAVRTPVGATTRYIRIIALHDDIGSRRVATHCLLYKRSVLLSLL